MTKDEIVNEVLKAIGEALNDNGWEDAAGLFGYPTASSAQGRVYAKLKAALAPIAERMAAESRERAVMREAMEALKEGDFYSWCYVRGGPGTGLDTSVAEDYILNVTWLLSTLPTLKPTAPAAPAEPTSEKARRVYYQDIVYSVCSVLDEIDGRKAGSGIICGTAETPSTEVQDRMKRLLAEWRNRATTTEPSKPSLEAALAVVLEAVQRTSASAIIVCQNGYRVGDGAYEAAWRVAEKLNQLARERHSEEISARQADVDAARKALEQAEAELARVKGGVT